MQAGFRPSFRTTENIFILRCLVERYTSERLPLVAVSIDIEKAFDKVSRPILWAKLKHFGASGPLLDLVKMMYSDPKVTIRLNRRYSKFIGCSNGVLQGCPLSPLLFIIYISDIPITSLYNPLLNGQRVSALMLADDVLLLATSSLGMENKISLLSRFLHNHKLRLNASKSWCMNLSVGRGNDPEIYMDNGDKVPFSEKEMYNGWLLSAKFGSRNWAVDKHMNRRFAGSNSVAQSLMALVKQLHIPTASLAVGMYGSLVEPELIYACESSFDSPARLNLMYSNLQTRYLKMCLGLPPQASPDLVVWDCGMLPILYRRVQLTCRFFFHLTKMHSGRLAFHALRDSIFLAIDRQRGWYHELNKRVPCPLPDIGISGECELFPGRVDQCLRKLHWEKVLTATYSNANLRCLNWSPPTVSLKKADYLFLTKHDTRSIARLRFGMNGLAVHRLAWVGVPWDDRRCGLCNEVETETHVLVGCGAFRPEREEFFMEMEDVHEECRSWSTARFMRTLVKPNRVEAAIVAGFLRKVWKDIDERLMEG